MPLVIGLTGPNASGKGEAARLLREMGFAYHSLSDVVREQARALARTTGRDDLIRTGNELREAHGPGVLAERLIARLGARDVVDSIRNPAEVAVLRRVPGFVLLGITAPLPLRYARACQRSGRGDALDSLEAFALKEQEEQSDDPSRQRLAATFALADHVLGNDGTLDDLAAALSAWVAVQSAR